jgi:sodium-dependent dicarboxylate transporter 2/3/5
MTLPISTPPNAIASSTGLVPTLNMVKVGVVISVAGALLGFGWIVMFPLQ